MNTNPPSVSVIVAARNAASTLEVCLASLQAQTFPDWQGVIVDDGSTDSTWEIARRFAEQDHRMLALTQPARGVSSARNSGIQAAQADWLVFLDADDTLAERHLERLTGAVRSYPQLGAVHCGWTRFRDGKPLFGEEFCPRTGDLFDVLAVRPAFIIHSCLVRRQAVLDVGMFDPSLSGGVDWDLWQRIARAGTQFGAVRDVLAHYRITRNSVSSHAWTMLDCGLRVIRTGHGPDDRVRRPAPKHASGHSSEDLFAAEVHLVCWCAASLLMHSDDPLPALDRLPRGHRISPVTNSIAETMMDAFILRSPRPLSRLLETWLEVVPEARRFLQAAEERVRLSGFASSVQSAITSRVLERSPPALSMRIGATYATSLDAAIKLSALKTPPGIERLHCSVHWHGERIGSIEIPVVDGEAEPEVLRDALSRQFAWPILGAFFRESLYPKLDLRTRDGAVSAWRDTVEVGHWPQDDQAPATQLHDRAGWTLFLQELWGRPSWDGTRFYEMPPRDITPPAGNIASEEKSDKARIRLSSLIRRFHQKPVQPKPPDRCWIEIGAPLPSLPHPFSQEAVILLAGFPIGVLPAEKAAVIVQPDQWIAAITEWAGFDLCRAAVRELIIGWPDEPRSLRERLEQCAQTQRLSSGKHRRSTNPLLAGTRPTKSEGSRQPPGSSVHGQPLASGAFPMPSTTESLRLDFESLFALGEDPWGYTNEYERVKYEQTASLLNGLAIGRALELACAEGHFTQRLAALVQSLLATDISQIALDRAKQRCAALQNVSFKQLDLVRDNLGGPFDLIVCSEVLYYVADRETLRSVADKIARALTDEGCLLSAHANLVVDEPDRPGRDWNLPFGAKTIEQTLFATEGLRLSKQILTPLYRIQLFQRTHLSQQPISVETQAGEMGALPPKVAARVKWDGGNPIDDRPKPGTERLPILMYHRIAPLQGRAPRRYQIACDDFEEQIRFLRDSGVYSTTLQEWREAQRRRQPLPGKAVILTFDDGYRDFLQFAWPILERYSFSALLLIVTGKAGGASDWSHDPLPLLNWDEIRQLHAAGLEFGSHTHTHRSLLTLSTKELIRECSRSRQVLEQELGCEITTLSYPYGETDRVAEQIARAAGYGIGLGTRFALSTFIDDPLHLPRIEITGNDPFETFAAKLWAGTV